LPWSAASLPIDVAASVDPLRHLGMTTRHTALSLASEYGDGWLGGDKHGQNNCIGAAGQPKARAGDGSGPWAGKAGRAAEGRTGRKGRPGSPTNVFGVIFRRF